MFSILHQPPQNYLLQPFLITIITIKATDFSVVGIKNIGICEIIISRKIAMCRSRSFNKFLFFKIVEFTSSFDFCGSIADL